MIVCLVCFNSITVQLILNKYYTCNDDNMFQFHNGTINTHTELLSHMPSSCFNSITVQLIPNIHSKKAIKNE